MMTQPSPAKHLPNTLVATALADDARVKEAKRLLHAALTDHQQQITAIRPPLESLKQSYDEALASLANYRGAKLWLPYLGSGLGHGALVELADGSIKYDFICGIGVHYFGHNHPDLLDAGIDTALSNIVMQGHLQQNIDALKLSELLIKASGFDHCFLTTSGAMANENALKIAFQKNFPANRILAFEGCFLGRTNTLSQVTDKPSFREGLPSNTAVDYIPFFDPTQPEESTARAVNTLVKSLKRYPKQHALMCFELIQGEGGFKVGAKKFFHAIMEILKTHHIAVFADEVQSFARTPELFAFKYFGLESFVDIASIGKVSQTCATFFTEEYKPRPGLLSQTFIASTSAIKASLVIINGLINGGYFGPEGKIARLHRHFAEKLEQLAKRHPGLIEGPYGIGCMVAFTPYGGDTQKVTQFIHRLFEAGVISFIAGGGDHPARVRFLIPVGAVTYRDINHVVDIIEHTLLSPADKAK